MWPTPGSARNCARAAHGGRRGERHRLGLGRRAEIGSTLSRRFRSRALYREAIERLKRTPLRPELARAHLLYGEWLRRENRRVDAREQLRSGVRAVHEDGMRGVRRRSGRASCWPPVRRCPSAPPIRRRTSRPGGPDRPARRDGHTNPEIGARLFISPRTVEWHLRQGLRRSSASARAGSSTGLCSGERRRRWLAEIGRTSRPSARAPQAGIMADGCEGEDMKPSAQRACHTPEADTGGLSTDEEPCLLIWKSGRAGRH